MWIWPIAGTMLLLVLAFIVRSVVEQSSKQTVADNLQAILNADVAALNIWLEREESLAVVLANEPRIQELAKDLSTVDQENPDDREALLQSKSLGALRNEFKSEMEHLGYLDVGLLSLNGRVLASTRDEPVGRANLPIQKSALEKVQQGTATVTRPFESLFARKADSGGIKSGVADNARDGSGEG